MPSWSEIFNEIKDTDNIDEVRYKYMQAYSAYTGREVISYYSAFNSKQNCSNLEINDSDMTGITNAVSGLDCDRGLDLILHTPGGYPTAAERIVKYLREKFSNDIRVIVPSQAMSAGTMIALSSKEIIMTKHACLGPIDPQFNGLPALDLLNTINEAKRELETNPEKSNYWFIELQKFPPSYDKLLIKSIELSTLLAKDWLGSCMFDSKCDNEKIERIVKSFNENEISKTHGRPFDYSYCKDQGLNVKLAEDDQIYQDALLSLHHCYIINLDNYPAAKIIENNIGRLFVSNANAQ